MAKESNSAAVDTYLATLAEEDRKTLQSLRELIKSEVPGVSERISYGTSVIFALDRDLVGFVAQPKHLSCFTYGQRARASLHLQRGRFAHGELRYAG